MSFSNIILAEKHELALESLLYVKKKSKDPKMTNYALRQINLFADEIEDILRNIAILEHTSFFKDSTDLSKKQDCFDQLLIYCNYLRELGDLPKLNDKEVDKMRRPIIVTEVLEIAAGLTESAKHLTKFIVFMHSSNVKYIFDGIKEVRQIIQTNRLYRSDFSDTQWYQLMRYQEMISSEYCKAIVTSVTVDDDSAKATGFMSLFTQSSEKEYISLKERQNAIDDIISMVVFGYINTKKVNDIVQQSNDSGFIENFSKQMSRALHAA